MWDRYFITQPENVRIVFIVNNVDEALCFVVLNNVEFEAR